MYSFIATFILALIVSLIVGFKDKDNNTLYKKIGFGIAFAIIPGCFAWGLIGMIVSFTFGNYNTTIKETDSVSIVSLRNTDGTVGSFTLGCGYIDKIEYYHAFAKSTDGCFYRIKVPVHRAVIKEVDNIENFSPVVKTYGPVINQNFWGGFSIICDASNKTTYTFIVPKGTIVQQFRVE